MQVKKQNLEVFFYALKGTEGELTLAESRARDSFIKPLAEVTDTYIKDRAKIYETFCLKKEDGSIDFLVREDKTTAYQFPPEKFDEINTELKTLGDEEVELTPPDKLKDILEKTKWSPKVGEVAILDEIIAKL